MKTYGSPPRILADPTAPEQAARKGYVDPALAGANAAKFLQRLKTAAGDVSWLILGDSTGNATDEWVHLAAQGLAARYPAYTVVYHLWDTSGGAAYDTGTSGTPVTLQTGTGGSPPTLHVWNCSVAGSAASYARGSRWAAAVLATNPHYIVINYGHNEGTSAGGVTADVWRAQMAALTESLTEVFPNAELAITLQNPRGDGVRDPELRAQVYRELAAARGYGILDVQAVFLAQPSLSGLIQADNLHPTAAGSQLWANEVLRVLTWSVEARPRSQGPSLFALPARNLLLNGDFSIFPSPPTLPYWTATNATLSKDVRAGWVESPNGYTLRVQAASAAQTSIYQDVPTSLVDLLKGKYVTVLVRMKVASGQPSTAGRVQIQDSAGTYASSASADLRDGWHWVVATRKIDAATTFVRVRIYADSGSSATADISVAGVYLVLGVLPRIGAPTEGLPIGAAGGSLAGTYPNPTLGAGVVGGTEIASAIKDPAAATAGLRTLGTGAQQAVAGNDSRLSDARTPTGAAGGSLAGTYPNPTIASGAVGGTEIASAIKDPAAGTAGLRTLGAGAQQAAAGNDSRLSDARTPLLHAASHASGGGDPITPAAIGAAASAHTHAGGDITSGTIAAARLPLVPNPPVVLTYGTNPTIDASLGNYRVITATGDLTLGTTINNPADGQMLRVRVIASGAQRTVTFAAALRRATGIASTLVIPSGKRGDIGLLYEAADGWTVLAATVQQ